LPEGNDRSLLSKRVLARESLRAIAAFGVYLLLHPVWTRLPPQSAYESFVLRSATALRWFTGHFPAPPAVPQLPVRFLDFLLVLTVAYAAVSLKLPWRIRLGRAVAMAGVIVAAHVTATALQMDIDRSRSAWSGQHVMLLLPRELQLAIWLKYLLYEGGLQIAPFLMAGLWASWNANADRAGPPAPPSPSRRRPLGITIGAVGGGGVIACLALAWGAARERDPRHGQAHLWFGTQDLSQGHWSDAETQFTAALEGVQSDGRAWYGLALARHRRGDVTGSVEALERGLEVVSDPVLRRQMMATRDDWTSRLRPPDC
jgi:hypothetical protein